MPTKPPSYRPYGMTSEQRRTAVRVEYDKRRPSAAKRGYDRRWRKVREIVLNRQPLCRQCEAAGRKRAATDVDHIVPISDGGARYSVSNLQPLCRSCHNIKTRAQR